MVEIFGQEEGAGGNQSWLSPGHIMLLFDILKSAEDIYRLFLYFGHGLFCGLVANHHLLKTITVNRIHFPNR